MSDICVRIENLGKRYRLGQTIEPYRRLTETLWNALKFSRRTRQQSSNDKFFWALKDVSLEILEGEVVGVIGRNGAGKTTLLKILSRITEPTAGTAEIEGRVRTLLEVGTGFHPELSGRENIFLNGAILGMSRAETAARFDEIVAFSGLERFLETPVKRYSTGMYVRLAFAVAAHLEPEILIVDEVLSVGDSAFQKKCLGKIGQVSRQGRTVIFVSHNMSAVERLCSRAFLLEEGKLRAEGPVLDVLREYSESTNIVAPSSLRDRLDRRGSGQLRLLEFESNLVFGKRGTVRIKYEGPRDVKNASIAMEIHTLTGERVATLSSDFTNENQLECVPRTGWFVGTLERVPLLPGTYSFNVRCSVNGELSDLIVDAGRFPVWEGDFFGTGKGMAAQVGWVAVPHAWSYET